ncbi:MAG: bifunctional 5,10-methylene-tetrahydrofolate dehydrogenase/5,10-methylene-tetrahydrofolate cyclohydrolase [Spirochaetes bacterium]|nr:bifunctional 5,10-methylene-tetrahydrofolate dehydrogenase/5,10-methylene-tetrahydrofolate cyclohydrolase [Spirochaetota bacterium]
MEKIILDGKHLAGVIETNLKERVSVLKKEHGFEPVLATILVGDDPSSEIYVNMKANACGRVGIGSRKIRLPQETSTDELLKVINELNSDADVTGILLQHPVPHQIDESRCFNAIDIEKDVDGVTATGFGRMALNQSAYCSATPGGIIRLLDYYKIDVTGKRAVVIGRSPILGKPMAMMLLNKNATVTICHSKTRNLSEIVSESDVVVAAIGKPEFIRAEWITEGSVIIDAGYHPGKIGDVDKNAFGKASAYTPVPGGVGPMTIATLIEQTVQAAEKKVNQK